MRGYTRVHIQANDLQEANKLISVENRLLKQDTRASARAAANVQRSKHALQKEHASLQQMLQEGQRARLLAEEALLTAHSRYNLSAVKVNERQHTCSNTTQHCSCRLSDLFTVGRQGQSNDMWIVEKA